MDKLEAIGYPCFWAITGLLNPFAQAESRNRPPSLDWEEVWRFCSFHGVRPALSKALDDLGQTVRLPARMRNQLADFKRSHTFSVLRKTGEIVALSKAFEAAEITIVIFKGAVLGAQVFGGAQYREFNDIDLLVPPEERDRATDVLEALRFRPIITDRRMRGAFFDYMGQHMFRSLETGSVVDLHWSFVGDVPFPVTGAKVLRDRTMLELGGTHVPAPCLQDLALILAGHGQKEGWASFGWALDFAKFAATAPGFDWSEAASRARTQGCLRSLLTATLITQRLFGEAIDDEMVAMASQRRIIVEDTERIIVGYAALAQRKFEDDLWGSFRLCETPTQRAKVWIQLLVRPTIGDYEAMPLTPSLWWAYRLTRPFRLLWRKIRGVQPVRSAL